jgi:hypothetical protein
MKEGMLRIFTALKNSSLSAGFQPTNIWSRGKLAKHYTIEDDNRCTYYWTDEVWYSRRLWACQQVLFELLFCLMKLSNMAITRNIEVMVG